MKNDHFRIISVETPAPYRLDIIFGDGLALSVNLSETINRIQALAPLKDPKLFSRAQVGEHGLAVTWIADELELNGDNLRAKAIEQAGGISYERIWDWMHRNRLTLDTAAEALGISRRMLAYYRSGQKPIPKHIWLACVGWEAERNKAA